MTGNSASKASATTRTSGGTPAASATAAADGPGGRPGRLRGGELRAMTAHYLAAHAGQDLTPGQIARALDRSAGAVANALTTLAGSGAAHQVSDKPVRYRATTTTSTAATAVTGAGPTGAGAGGTAVPGGAGSGAGVARRAAKPRRRSTAPAAPATGAPGSGAAEAGTVTPAAGTGAPVAGVVVEVEPVTGPVTRPNGTVYHPRLVGGTPDVAMLRRLRVAGVPVLLYGPPGTGKTSLIEAAFPDLLTVAGDGETTVDQIIGDYAPNPAGGYEFVDGPLIQAMRAGRPLFIDDATLISPTVLAVVYPAMDGRGQIVVKSHRGEVVTAAPGFYVVAGHNPGVHGAVLTEALASRFAVDVAVSSDYDLARTLGVDARAVRVARNLSLRVASGEAGWAPQLRELLTYLKVRDALGVEVAVANLIGAAPETDRPTVAAIVKTVYGREFTPLALGPRI